MKNIRIDLLSKFFMRIQNVFIKKSFQKQNNSNNCKNTSSFTSIQYEGYDRRLFIYAYMGKVKVTIFGRVYISYSAVGHPLTNNFPWSMGYIRKLAFESPWGYYLTPGFVCIQHTEPRNIKLAQTPPAQGTWIHTLVVWILGDSFLVPWDIHVRPV